MAEKWSGAVRVADLNDFIAPSQACVVNLKGQKQSEEEQQGQAKDGLVQIQARKIDFPQVRKAATDEAIKVSLHDCLACSGCITSAETVMLQQQSTDEFVQRLSSATQAVVVSLSPQSRASLATHYGITPLQAFRKLTGFLKSLGVRAVFDTSCSRDLSLLESCQEFVDRYRKAAGNSATKQGELPMLASACPGWVCYAEKTHGQHILPHISSTKSPQQVMGTLVKRHACYRLGLRPEDIYHVTIMPCYDKKLEAARDDFIFAVDPGGGTGDSGQAGPRVTEVDSVLTSGEILDLLESRGVDFAALEEAPLDLMLSSVDEAGHVYGVRGGAGGYLETNFRHAARVLFGQTVEGPLQMKTLRNADFKEVSLEVDGKRVLHFAAAYGFRNIQNLVRKIKQGKCEYQFVEIMACPAGCLNGGGQIKPRKGQTAKDLIQHLEAAYLHEVTVRDPADNPLVQELYRTWLGGPYSENARSLLHTQYHERERTVTASISNW
ncbi:ferredoxin hydrogenase [Klebsormidium nitens]|uniref:Ferredoxin hydrogenase n=1 Tax=Klebsormidium nitens TaxID=105231 RepID=A0A1Y1II93_KLENI|nr:ferredoxin hydrogenase [Klebsormidium nitens]|eukprot:GAQ90605.1 ferredoxin hydrogenase [Klebsormidium nitens]